ncbi:MAG: TIGR03435 family protein [Ignavibacteriota bacterium]
MKDYQIVAPSWAANEKYEVIANMPAGADRSQAPAMLRTLLESRFHLQTHSETRSLPVYALVTTKGGAKLVAADGPLNRRGGDAWVDHGMGHLRALNSSAAVFADLLTKVSDRPVIDGTGLSGIFNFDLTYSPELSASLNDRPTLAAALAELGLKLEKRDTKIEVLVVDHSDKLPTGN